MTTIQPPKTLDEGTEELARQLTALRRRSRRVALEVQRIRTELVDLIKRIDLHIASKDGVP